MIRDPARSKSRVGHRPGSIPAEGPFEVVSAKGSSAQVRNIKTGEIRDVHGENVIYLRSVVADYEEVEEIADGDVESLRPCIRRSVTRWRRCRTARRRCGRRGAA